MLKIFKPTKDHIPAIISLATKSWHDTYSSLISEEQIDFMLNKFYNANILLEQMNDSKNDFLALEIDGEMIAYAQGIDFESYYKLSKLYCATKHKGKGYGKKLLNEIETLAQKRNFKTIELCVNRGNPAQYFYEKNNYKIDREEDFPIGDFWMNDYVMKKDLV